MSGINRFLSRREKRPSATQSKKPHVVSGDIYGVFTADDKKKKVEKDEDKKIKAVTHQLTRLGITNLREPQIEYALRSKHSSGDQEKAFDLLVLFEDSVEGIIKDYDPNIKLLGAENRAKVTCYLDALLFAMFARLGSFEAILYNTFPDEQRKRLANLLRLWVNLLRTGKLITVDLTKHVQEALAACGWEEAAELSQQDASEAFTFITERLELPHLTLKMDIYHTGKEDANDDHKFINERLLEVAIPTDLGKNKSITLEDCLEAYFNNRIEVKRHMERRATMKSVSSCESFSKAGAVHIEYDDLGDDPSSPGPQSQQSTFPFSAVPQSPTSTRDRAQSIIRDRLVSSDDDVSAPHSKSTGQPIQRKHSSMRKEVMMPAWQFFSLIPWYTDNTPTSDAQVAAHFSTKRPVVGLCLKRYSMLPNGKAARLNTYVDIPLEIGLPHFIQDDKMHDDGPIFGNFKLSLQSVVCHRGVSVDSGHYIALVRGKAPNAQKATKGLNGTTGAAKKEDGDDDKWMRFDDLAKERVTYVDIQKALKDESPYLLFYQVLPIDVSPMDVVNGEAPPPPYSEPSVVGTTTTIVNGSAATPTTSTPGLESPRVSFDVTTPAIATGSQISESDSGRHRSIASTNNSIGDSNATASHSAATHTHADGEANASSAASRRPSRSLTAEARTLPVNQNSENRLSATISRLAARISRDKLQTADDNINGPEEEAVVLADQVQAEDKSKDTKAKTKKDKKVVSAKYSLEGERAAEHQVKIKAPDRECTVM